MPKERLKTKASNTTEYNDSEVLRQLLDAGIITSSDVENAMTTSKLEKEVAKYHTKAIYRGSKDRWCTYVDDDTKKNKRRLISKTHREDLMKELYKFYTNKEYRESNGITVAQFYPKWLEYKKKHTQASTTITRVESDWKKYYKDTKFARTPISDLNKVMLDEWAHDMIKKYDMTKKMYINMSLIIRQMLDYAVDLEIINKNHMRDVKINGRVMFKVARKKKDETQVYSPEEMHEIIRLSWQDFGGSRFHQPIGPLAIPFQFYTGLRIGELVAVRYEDISPDGTTLTVQRMVRRDKKEIVEHTKGSFGDREVLLTSEARHIIETAKAYQEAHGYPTDGYIFSITDQPISSRTVTDLYIKYCKKMGIPTKNSHKARKTFTSICLDSDMNINTVREMLGHVDERTTLNNYCYDVKSREQKMEQLELAFTNQTAVSPA